MTTFKSLVIAGCCVLVPGLASAATTTYDATNFGGDTGLWTDNLVQNQGGGNFGSGTWSISDGTFVTDDVAKTASFTGNARYNSASDLGLAFNLKFRIVPRTTQTGYCQYGGTPYRCTTGDAATPAAQYTPVGTLNAFDWTYFELEMGSTLAGLAGTEMEGILLNLTDVTQGEHLPQLGIGANAFDREDLGYSSWLAWEADGTSVDNSIIYNFLGSSTLSSNKHLDFNVDLAVADVSAVPLPASALLLIGGLGSLGAMRRRRKAA